MKNKPDRSQLPKPGKLRPFNFPKFERIVLDNGLTVIYAEHHKLPIVSAQFLVNVSPLNDPKGKEGLTAMTADLLTEGAGGLTSIEIVDKLEMFGSHFASYSDWNGVYVDLNAASDHFEKSFAIFSEICLKPDFPENEFHRILRQKKIDRSRLNDSNGKLASEQFSKLLYGAFRYSIPQQGNLESLENLSLNDVKHFYQNHFSPQNSTLILAGDLKKDFINRTVVKLFSRWKNKPSPQKSEKFSYLKGGNKITILHKKGTTQAALQMGHIGVSRSNTDYKTILMMNNILGGYFLSRLNMNLREDKGYTYGISSFFSIRKQTGPFSIGASIDEKNIANAISEIFKEVRKIASELVPQEEFMNAKGFLIGTFPQAFESVEGIARALTNIITHHLEDDYYRNFRDKLQPITPEQTLHAAKKYILDDQFHIAICADAEKIEKSLSNHFTVEVLDMENYSLI
jgi:predicted Zn-dependent peptidase